MERILAKKKMVAGIVLLLLLAVAGIVGFQMWNSGAERTNRRHTVHSVMSTKKLLTYTQNGTNVRRRMWR